MTWARDLLFFCVVLLGLAAVAGLLLPDAVSRRADAEAPHTIDRASLRPIVEMVDAALHREWEAARLEPVSEATELAIARRVSLALTGTIPSLEEIRWLENQPAGERVDRWVDRLLEDRRFADYVAERLARAYVGVEEGPFLVYRRRRFVSWLADELLANRPYDQIVRELITSQGIWTDQPATNFLTVTIVPDQEDNDPSEVRLAGRVARAFLGIRLDCAECHDHPFEDWLQSDFQSLAAFFGGVDQTFTGIRDGDGEFTVDDPETEQSHAVEPGVPFLAELLPHEGSLRGKLAAWVTHPENRAFSRATVNRLWALLFGRPLVEPIDDIPHDGNVPETLEILAQDFASGGYDLKRLLRVITATEAFHVDSRAAAPQDSPGELQETVAAADASPPADEFARHWAQFPLTRLRPEQVVGALIQAASLETIDYESHILVRFFKAVGQNEFVQRYGDVGEDEFRPQMGTIPQRLLLMNGELVRKRTEANPFNASGRIAVLAPTDAKAVETAYLAVLTRRPTDEEREHFTALLAGTSGGDRRAKLVDLYWSLVNSTEFSWNH